MLKTPVTADDHIQGDASAKVVLVEYGDYECPHCGHAHPIVKRLQKHFGDSLALVFRNFPLQEIHPLAEPAAEAAEFAATQGKFWEMHDAIFEHQNRLSPEMLAEEIGKLGLDSDAAAEAISNGQFAERISNDFSGGVRSGVNGTPTFFINGTRHDMGPDFDSLKEAIEAAK